jgi:type II secretory pathway pseudopilin PulG
MNRHKTTFSGQKASGGGVAGFTAIELSAVATVIAILALILIPVMRKQVEEAKVTAAQDDMRSIEQAQGMIHGYTGQYVRLFDLNLPGPSEGDDLATAQGKIPKATWNQPLADNAGLRNNFLENFSGPYGAIHRSKTVFELLQTHNDLFHGDVGPSAAPSPPSAGGPILVVPEDDSDHLGDAALQRRKYPLDPWGNPYLFFGPGRFGELGGGTANNTIAETDFNSAIVYSMGPNGAPGDKTVGITSADYFRETGVLGTGDDLSREF